MNSSIIASGTPQSNSIVVFITQPARPQSMLVTSPRGVITKGPVVLKPASLPEDYDARVEKFLRFIDSLGSDTETADDITAEQ